MSSYSLIDLEDQRTIKHKFHSSFPIIQSVIEGVQQGQVYMNGRGDCWVLHKAGFSEIFLDDKTGYQEFLEFILEREGVPRYFHIYDPQDNLMLVLRGSSELFNVRERRRLQLKYKPAVIEGLRQTLDTEFTLAKVTHENFDSLSVFNLDLANRFWNDRDEFINNAAAVFVRNKDIQPVSLCYAAAIVGQVAEIDVVTTENYRGRGLAKFAVDSFISNCACINIVPNWDCFEDNIQSLRTALSAGFFKNRLYNFVSIYRK